MMDSEIILTADGSHTLRLKGTEITYHSNFGAVQESKHIFINAGLNEVLKRLRKVSILDIGFGTGLNAFLSFARCSEMQSTTYYEAIEKFPLPPQITSSLNYSTFATQPGIFNALHAAPWENAVTISPAFTLLKRKVDLENATFFQKFDLVYFDAFDPATQPELWTTGIFKKIFDALSTEAILVTYSSKGLVRRSLQEAGFVVEKLPGPPGKREITRAKKCPGGHLL